MKHLIVGLFTLTSALGFAKGDYTPGKYAIDSMHSSVAFEIPHLVISSVEGKFKSFSGNLDLKKDLDDSSVTATIDVASIDTGVEKRDNHLKSGDFFDAAKHKSITFKSTKVSGSAKDLKIKGDLTIKGITKTVTLKGKLLGSVTDGYGNQKVAFTAKTEISRKDFGLTWNNMVEAGPVVGDEVTIELKIQAAKQK